MKRLVLLLLVAGCGMELDGSNTNDAGPGTCTLTLSFDPAQPVASSVSPIRAQATLVGAPGVPTYTWTVDHNGPIAYSSEAADGSQIGFIASVAGSYRVTLDVGGVDSACDHKLVYLDVGDPNGVNDIFRLRTVASPSLAPPQETVIQLRGNTSEYNRDIALDPGLAFTGAVKNGPTPVPAYIKLVPVGAPNAFTETYSGSDGAFNVRLLGQMHSVLIIPTSTTLAPRLAAWMPGLSDFTVSAGTLVKGNVRGPGNSLVAGAKVQLIASDGTPSTIGNADANGDFSLRADFATTAMKVKVTPPATSGLPRLEATGTFDLGQSLQVDYAALTLCDLAGDAVKRGGANQPGAKVTFVGSMTGSAGTIGGVAATGTVHITATANGSGVLPQTLVPHAAMSAVVELAKDDYAVDTVDTTSCAAQTIDAAAPITRSGVTTKDATTTLGGVRIEATPIGVLAQADSQPIIATANSSGAFSIALAAGGQYDVRFVDPAAGAAPLALMNIAPASIPATVTLPKAMTIFGDVSVTGIANPVVGASVQLLCATCSGLEASRPIAGTATDSASHYRVAVPDPGVN